MKLKHNLLIYLNSKILLIILSRISNFDISVRHNSTGENSAEMSLKCQIVLIVTHFR